MKKIIVLFILLTTFLFSVNIPSDNIFVKKFINKGNCDLILKNHGYFTTCYDYKLKFVN